MRSVLTALGIIIGVGAVIAMVSIGTSLFFAEISGSAVADVAALGSVLIPAMQSRGYPRPLSAATISLTLGILVLANTVELWEVYLLALLLGIVNSFDMPIRQAFVVEMVGREDVANAVALNSALFNMARIVGPAIAGLTIAAIGLVPLMPAFGLPRIMAIRWASFDLRLSCCTGLAAEPLT